MEKIKNIIEYIKLLFFQEDNSLNLFGKIIASILILFLTYIMVKISQRTFNKFISKNEEKFISKLINSKKRDTLNSIIGNILRYFIYFISFMLILRVFGVNTKYLAGTAGIGGVAIGFGAQSIVKDVISGLFIMLENQFEIGDNVVINNTITGNIVEFGIKTTKIQGFDGSINIIGNGNITTVQNKSRGNQRSNVEIIVSNRVSISEIEEIVQAISDKFKNNKDITVKPYLLGVTDTSFNGNMKISILAWSKPGKEVTTGIQIRELFFKEAINRKIDIYGNSNMEFDEDEVQSR